MNTSFTAAAAFTAAIMCLPAWGQGVTPAENIQKPELVRSERQEPKPSDTQKMVLSLKTELHKCWQLPVVVQSVKTKPVVSVRFELDRQGKVVGTPAIIDQQAETEELKKPMADSAIQAIRKCQPYSIAKNFPQYYDTWRIISIRFDPKDK